MGARGEAPTLECLEAKLADVKLLVPPGAPTLDDLEDELGELNQLFSSKFQDTQGMWSVVRGEAPTLECLEAKLSDVKGLLPLGAPTMDDLEDELNEIKQLFSSKFQDTQG